MHVLTWAYCGLLCVLAALLIAALRAHKQDFKRVRENGCTCDRHLLGLRLDPECPVHQKHYLQTLGQFQTGDFVYTCFYDYPAFIITPFLPDPLEEGSQEIQYQVLYYGVPEQLANIKSMQEAYHLLGIYADRVLPRGFEYCLLDNVAESDVYTPREHARLRRLIEYATR